MTDPVVAGLIAKRAELAGIIDQLQRQLDQHRADLTHIDGVLRILAPDFEPETIRPKRRQRRSRYFARYELSRLCLDMLREAATEPLSTEAITRHVIVAKGFEVGDAVLRAAIHDQVEAVLKRMIRDSRVEKIGGGHTTRWKLVSG
jgi:hypothetical protein